MRGPISAYNSGNPTFRTQMPKLQFDPEHVQFGQATRSLGRYGVAQAAGYTQIPASTIRAWFIGTTHGKGLDKQDFSPILSPANDNPKLLSFDNLVEAHVLRAFRNIDKLHLRAIEKAIKVAQQEFGVEKPLLSPNLWTGSGGIFLSTAGTLVGLNDPKQLLFPGSEEWLSRLTYADDAAQKLFPITRRTSRLERDADTGPRIVAISADFGFGQPVVDRTKVSTDAIAARYRNGDSVADLAEDLSCEIIEVEEAIRAEWIFAYAQKNAA